MVATIPAATAVVDTIYPKEAEALMEEVATLAHTLEVMDATAAPHIKKATLAFHLIPDSGANTSDGLLSLSMVREAADTDQAVATTDSTLGEISRKVLAPKL